MDSDRSNPSSGERTTLPVAIGGLMRCCLATYDAKAPPAENTSEGDVLPCDSCSSSMVVRNWKWVWNHPPTDDIPSLGGGCNE